MQPECNTPTLYSGNRLFLDTTIFAGQPAFVQGLSLLVWVTACFCLLYIIITMLIMMRKKLDFEHFLVSNETTQFAKNPKIT